LSQLRQAFCQDVTPEFVTNDTSAYVRLFNFTPAQRKATEKKLNRTDTSVREIYEYSHVSKRGSLVWVER